MLKTVHLSAQAAEKLGCLLLPYWKRTSKELEGRSGGDVDYVAT